jgi:hypothetical protein
MQYSNTEYSEASEITTSSKSSFASGRSSLKSVDESTVASSVATRSSASHSNDSESVFVNRICEGIRARIPDRTSKLTTIAMNKPDTSRECEEGKASNEDQDSTTTKTSVSSGMPSSTSGRSTGFGSPSAEILVYKLSKRRLSKAKSGFITPEATESNIEVVARTGSMDTESTPSTKRSATSTTPGDAGVLVPTRSLLKFASSRRSAEPEIGGHTTIILSWNSL